MQETVGRDDSEQPSTTLKLDHLVSTWAGFPLVATAYLFHVDSDAGGTDESVGEESRLLVEVTHSTPGVPEAEDENHDRENARENIRHNHRPPGVRSSRGARP